MSSPLVQRREGPLWESQDGTGAFSASPVFRPRALEPSLHQDLTTGGFTMSLFFLASPLLFSLPLSSLFSLIRNWFFSLLLHVVISLFAYFDVWKSWCLCCSQASLLSDTHWQLHDCLWTFVVLPCTLVVAIYFTGTGRLLFTGC